jgi:hypothetical protein
MRVRILQGKQTGLVTEVCQSEGENLLTTGFAELAPIEAPPPTVSAPPEPALDGDSHQDVGVTWTNFDDADLALPSTSTAATPPRARGRRRAAVARITSPSSSRRKRR